MSQRISYPLIDEITQLLLLGTLIASGFFLAGAVRNQNWDHWYLFWNLLLAWVPFGVSVWLHRILHTKSWTSWLPLVLTFVWLSFLPNTFYMLTDYIHVTEGAAVNESYNVALFTAVIAVSVALGFASLALVHLELRRRLPAASSWRAILLVLLLVSFAIYVGRDLRWNSWDILTHPAGILFDISERVIHPTAHPQTYITTLSFFVLLSSGYYGVWRVVGLLRKQTR